MLQRYLIKEISVLYWMGILLFVALISFDFISSASGVLLRSNTQIGQILMLVVYNLPRTLTMSAPLGLVFAILITLSRWIRHSELKATFAAAIKPSALIWPVVGLGFVVSLLLLYALGWVRPSAEAKFDALWDSITGGSSSSILSNQVYAPKGLGLYYAELVKPSQGSAPTNLEGIKVIQPDGTVITAQQGQWNPDGWLLRQPTVVKPDGTFSTLGRMSLAFVQGIKPADSASSFTPFGRQTIPELHQQVKIDSSATFWLSRRYADAFSAMVLAFVAIVVGLGFKQPSHAFVAVAAIIFGYWSLWMFAQQLAQLESLEGLGAWLPNIVFAIIGFSALPWSRRAA